MWVSTIRNKAINEMVRCLCAAGGLCHAARRYRTMKMRGPECESTQRQCLLGVLADKPFIHRPSKHHKIGIAVGRIGISQRVELEDPDEAGLLLWFTSPRRILQSLAS
jgi:hypothetical protein